MNPIKPSKKVTNHHPFARHRVDLHRGDAVGALQPGVLEEDGALREPRGHRRTATKEEPWGGFSMAMGVPQYVAGGELLGNYKHNVNL